MNTYKVGGRSTDADTLRAAAARQAVDERPRRSRTDAIARLAQILGGSPLNATAPAEPSYMPSPGPIQRTYARNERVTPGETLRYLSDGFVSATRDGRTIKFAPSMSARDRDVIFAMRPRRRRDQDMAGVEIGMTIGAGISVRETR